MSAKYVITKTPNGKYIWTLVASNGIAISQSVRAFESMTAVTNSINNNKKYSLTDEVEKSI